MQTKTRNTKTDPTATQEKPAAEPKPFLPRTVERIAAAVANMLRYGGEPEDLEELILATVSDEIRGKSFSSVYRTKIEETVRNRQRIEMPGMLKDLAEFRIERPEFKKDESVLTTIAERVRQSSREQCAREFESFLRDADPEEIRFLYNVLNWWGSKGSHNNELSIATAFLDEVDSDVEIFRVPQEHSAAVEQYIGALLKADSVQEAA